MSLDPRLQALPLGVWELLALCAIGLFFAAVGLVCFSARVRDRLILGVSIPLLPVCYLLMQGFLALELMGGKRGAAHAAVKNFLLDLTPWVLIPAILGLILSMVLLWRRILRYWGSHITPMSVKEAVDNLPDGICCHLPGGRIVLINRAMEALAASAGSAAINGEALCRTLTGGTLAPDCRRVDTGEGPVLLLPDGAAWALSAQKLDWEGGALTAALAADVTEAYQKTLDLERQKERLYAINRQLAGYNREIVDLTIQAEILAARARLHDEIGADLLLMKKQLRQGVDPAGLEELRRRLRRSISCLREDSEAQTADELTVLLETARRLGVRVEIEGEVPQDAELSHVITTGLHECLTNLLRHAHGDTLRLRLSGEGDRLRAVFSGNGDPPAGAIRETGGLRILRATAEQLGGTMTVVTGPAFSVIVELPKEVPNAL